jgi:hypothetical protein
METNVVRLFENPLETDLLLLDELVIDDSG